MAIESAVSVYNDVVINMHREMIPIYGTTVVVLALYLIYSLARVRLHRHSHSLARAMIRSLTHDRLLR